MPIDTTGLIFYSIVVFYTSKLGTNVKLASIFAGFSSVLFTLIMRYIMASIYGTSVYPVFTIVQLAQYLTQLVILFVIFKLVVNYEDSLKDFLIIVSLGGVVNYLLVPYLFIIVGS